jgi:S1-C subfamily serine protease
MARQQHWALPPELRPDPSKLHYDFEQAARSVVLLRSDVPEDAYTADALGTDRLGNGAIIEVDGRAIVITMGYLVAEARQIWITTHSGRTLEGHTLAYDYVSGLGLVQALGSLDVPALKLGSAAPLAVGDELCVLAHGGLPHSLATTLVGRREFAGYWEYLLDDALFVAPHHPLWGGTALLDHAGVLVALGSLLVQQTIDDERHEANMFVPLDVIEPVLLQLARHGVRATPSRPWLGMYSTENNGRIVVAGLLPTAPAHQAGIEPGDQVLEVGGEAVSELAQFYRALWRQGYAGAKVNLLVQRGRAQKLLEVQTARREQFLKLPVAH